MEFNGPCGGCQNVCDFFCGFSLLDQVCNLHFRWGDIEQFGGEVSFNAVTAIDQLNKLRESLHQVNTQIDAFTSNMEQFNAQVGTVAGLSDLVNQLRKFVEQQEEITKSTTQGNQALISADSVPRKS